MVSSSLKKLIKSVLLAIGMYILSAVLAFALAYFFAGGLKVVFDARAEDAHFHAMYFLPAYLFLWNAIAVFLIASVSSFSSKPTALVALFVIAIVMMLDFWSLPVPALSPVMPLQTNSAFVAGMCGALLSAVFIVFLPRKFHAIKFLK